MREAVRNEHSFTVTPTLTHIPLSTGVQKLCDHPVHSIHKAHIKKYFPSLNILGSPNQKQVPTVSTVYKHKM